MKLLFVMIFLITFHEISSRHCRMIETLVQRAKNDFQSYYKLTCYDIRKMEEMRAERPDLVEELIFGKSILNVLPASSFSSFGRLLHLRIENSNVNVIEPMAFDGLSTLETLSLLNNSISNISIGTLNFSSNLRSLDLSENFISKVENVTFLGLENLQELYLSHNFIADINSTTFSPLPNLEMLDLSYNKLRNFGNYTFSSMKNLEVLLLNNNFITNLPSSPFQDLIFLRILDISENRIKLIDFNDLPDSLEYIFANDNELFYIQDWSSLHDISATQLEKSNISNIVNIGKGITSLSLSNNQLGSLNNSVFGKCVDLLYLDVSHNIIADIEMDTFKDLFKLQHLNLSYNKLEVITFVNSSEDYYVDDSVEYSSSEEGSFNKILEAVNSSIFERNNELKQLDLSHNLITYLDPAALKNLFKLQTLNLSYNRLKYIPAGAFRDLIYLSYLKLSFNSLSHLEFGTFAGLESLTVLFLDNNNLMEILEKSFYVTRNLKALYLTNNALTKLNALDLVEVTKIKLLFINGNNWFCDTLLNITQILTKLGVGFQNGTDTDKENVYGIACKSYFYSSIKKEAEFLTKTTVKPQHNDFGDTKFYKYLNEDFSNSTFYKFFETNYIKSGFSNYLETGFKKSKFFKYFNKGFLDSKFIKYFQEDFQNSTFVQKLNGLLLHKDSPQSEESALSNITEPQASKFYSENPENHQFANFASNMTTFMVTNVALLFLMVLMFIIIVFRGKNRYKLVRNEREII